MNQIEATKPQQTQPKGLSAPPLFAPCDDPLDELGPCYIIAWASNLTTKSGMGTTKFLHSEAVKIARDANVEFTDLSHCVLPDTKMEYGRPVPRANTPALAQSGGEKTSTKEPNS